MENKTVKTIAIMPNRLKTNSLIFSRPLKRDAKRELIHQ